MHEHKYTLGNRRMEESRTSRVDHVGKDPSTCAGITSWAWGTGVSHLSQGVCESDQHVRRTASR